MRHNDERFIIRVCLYDKALRRLSLLIRFSLLHKLGLVGSQYDLVAAIAIVWQSAQFTRRYIPGGTEYRLLMLFGRIPSLARVLPTLLVHAALDDMIDDIVQLS